MIWGLIIQWRISTSHAVAVISKSLRLFLKDVWLKRSQTSTSRKKKLLRQVQKFQLDIQPLYADAKIQADPVRGCLFSVYWKAWSELWAVRRHYRKAVRHKVFQLLCPDWYVQEAAQAVGHYRHCRVAWRRIILQQPHKANIGFAEFFYFSQWFVSVFHKCKQYYFQQSFFFISWTACPAVLSHQVFTQVNMIHHFTKCIYRVSCFNYFFNFYWKF